MINRLGGTQRMSQVKSEVRKGRKKSIFESYEEASRFEEHPGRK